MYPDFGNECFWLASGKRLFEIQEFAPFLLPTSKLYKDIQKWCSDFQTCETKDFNWDEFDKQGRKLHKKLKKLLNGKHIIKYIRSYEEKKARKKDKKWEF